MINKGFIIGILFVSFSLMAQEVRAKSWEIDNIADTKHNLSSDGPVDRTVVTNVNEICVFCHTPHAANNNGPLWNRSLSQASYSMYKGSQKDTNWKGSFDAQMVGTTQGQPTGYSKLCLSCHDGSIAINSVINAPGSGGYNPQGSIIPGDSAIFMPFGLGEFTGDTRRLGTDLSNDHPISFRMTQPVIDADKELSEPNPADCANNYEDCKAGDPWIRRDGVRLYPLTFGETTTPYNAIQCTSCHNPHTTNTKFLRANLNNDVSPSAANRNLNRTQICEACHVKPGWVNSTHENAFPLFEYRNVDEGSSGWAPELDGLTVAQHGCLNCHDPHTMQGSDRLHRNGAGLPGNTYGANANQPGKTPAIENTCYQCHINTTDNVPNLGGIKNFLYIVGRVPFQVLAPDIKSVFDKNSNVTFDEMISNGSSMPLDRSWAATYEGDTNGIHQPVFVSQATLNNRQDFHDNDSNTEEKVLNKPQDDTYIHVECVDCHNPHQVNRFNRFKGMKGITIEGDIIGGDSGKAAADDRDSYDTDNLGGVLNMEPLVYEICFRCHGDSYNYNMPYSAKGTDLIPLPIPGPERLPERNRGHVVTNYGDQFGASNKKYEFDPDSNQWLGGTYITSYNTSYHPVNAPGKNGTVALYNQLAKAFKLWEVDPSTFTTPDSSCDGLTRSSSSPYLTSSDTLCSAAVLSRLTIQCTDCHNNSDLSNTNLNMDSPDGPIGPITGLPDGSSYRRPTDRPAASLSGAYGGALPYDIDPAKAQGPHGSDNPRILRAPYKTNLRSTDPGTVTLSDTYLYDNFGLCFQCHEKAVFLGDGPSVGTNFGTTTFGGTDNSWSNNLHGYHLAFTGAYCHECHNNVHSNVEANNTIYGDGDGGYLPPDESHDGINDGMINTHLINFGPQAAAATNVLPNWYYDNGQFRCNLECHGVTMSACSYSHGSSSGTNWSCGSASLPF